MIMNSADIDTSRNIKGSDKWSPGIGTHREIKDQIVKCLSYGMDIHIVNSSPEYSEFCRELGIWRLDPEQAKYKGTLDMDINGERVTVVEGNAVQLLRECTIEFMGFDDSGYVYPKGKGSFVGALVMKKWNQAKELICYFDTDEGRKYMLCAKSQKHTPPKSNAGLISRNHNTLWRVEYNKKIFGGATWITYINFASRGVNTLCAPDGKQS